jgi:hypothetical protein
MLLLAVVQVGTIIKKIQVTNKTQWGALTFSGGARPLNAPPVVTGLHVCMLNENCVFHRSCEKEAEKLVCLQVVQYLLIVSCVHILQEIDTRYSAKHNI